MSFPGAGDFLPRGSHACSAALFTCIRQMSLRALSAPERFVLCEHEGLLRSCEPGECVGRYSGRQLVHSEMSSLLAEDVNGSAAAGGARWGALCQECAGGAETL